MRRLARAEPSSTERTQSASLKRIAVLHQGANAIRGSEVVVIELVDGFEQNGIEVSLVANHPRLLTDQLHVPPRWVDECTFPAVLVEQQTWRAPFQYAAQLLGLWRKFRRRDLDLILASGGLPCQLGVPLAWLLGIPCVCLGHHPATRRYFYGWLVRWAKVTITPSQYTAQSVQRFGVPCTVVPIGIETGEKFRPLPRDPSWRAQLGIPATAFVAAQLGALEPPKRPEVLIRAIHRLRNDHCDAHALFIGDGSSRASLVQLARELDIADYVHFTGRVPDTAPYLQHVADVHALLSIEEGFGIALVEAAACGLPNVASVPGAMSEIVTDGVDGLHVDGSSDVSVASALKRLYLDPALRHALGVKGCEAANDRFSIARYRASIQSVLTSLLAQ